MNRRNFMKGLIPGAVAGAALAARGAAADGPAHDLCEGGHDLVDMGDQKWHALAIRAAPSDQYRAVIPCRRCGVLIGVPVGR